MENATRALIMAGSVLIALMILGALILMFTNLSSYQETDVQSTREAQVIEFNNQYETYNRKDVRGSDLYSLLNRAVDYNKRKSTGGDEEGKELAYEPITISVDFDNKNSQLSADGTNRLITKKIYVQSDTKNEFEDSIKSDIDALENKYGTGSLTNLTTGLTKIFLDSNSSESEQKNAVDNFNIVSKKVKASSWDLIKPGSTIREDVYKYYEYIQFKRGYFNCIKTDINKQTGRIVKMEFKFNGKIE